MTTNILIQKDANTLIPKTVTNAERQAWMRDFPIWDVGADGSKKGPFGPTLARVKEGSVTSDALGALKTGPTGATLPLALAKPFTPLINLATGNSIPKNGQWVAAVLASTSGGFTYMSEWAGANMLYPLGWNTRRMTAVSANAAATTVDILGNYGYSGATCAQIIADWPTNWFPNTNAAGIYAQLVSATDLFINDITSGASFGALQDLFWAADEALRSQWSGCIVEYNTPHMSTGVNTAAMKKIFNDFSDWMRLPGQNDGVSRLVTDLRDPAGYSDPSDRTQPLAAYILTPVHPDQNGTNLNARLMAKRRAAAFGSISSLVLSQTKPAKSAAKGMAGSVAVAAVTGFTGTRPSTAWGTPTPLTTAGECVCTATNPGAWNIAWTPTATGTLLTLQLTNTAGMPVGDVAGFAKIRINSGAANVAYATCNFQQQNAGGATKNYNQGEHGSSYQNYHFDGDVLWFYTPACLNPGALTGIYPTIYMRCLQVGVPINFDILAADYLDLDLFEDTTQSPAYAATYTPDFGLGCRITVGTLTANMAIANPVTVPAKGTKVRFYFTEDGTGGWTISSWGTNYIFATAWSNTGNTAGKQSMIAFESDGAKLIQQNVNVWY